MWKDHPMIKKWDQESRDKGKRIKGSIMKY